MIAWYMMSFGSKISSAGSSRTDSTLKDGGARSA
jgi:hypothetical protein